VAPIIAAEEELGGKAISEGWANVDEKKDEEYAKLFLRVSTRRLWLRRDVSQRPH